MRSHLVTGATGFIGSALALELLQRSDVELWCLVRGDSREEASERLRRVLLQAADAYGMVIDAEDVEARCHALPADLDEPIVDVEELPARLEQVWHVAASLKYLDRDADVIQRTNVGGTAACLELARRHRVEVFNHVSTAYVAGRRTGHILEAPASAEVPTNNSYERSKIVGELLASAAPFPVRILRPSIVIGHSMTMATFSTFGLYGGERQLRAFWKRVSRRLGAYVAHYRVQVRADPGAILNFVPVDFVVRNAVSIMLAEAPAGIYHLANHGGPTVAETCAALARIVGLQLPEYVDSEETFTLLDRQLNRSMDFHVTYLRHPKRFDTSHVDAICGAAASQFSMDTLLVEDFLRAASTRRSGREVARPAVSSAATE